jgi:hypothetical protein
MLIVAGCLLLAVGSVVLTQSSPELHNRYGNPGSDLYLALLLRF